MTLPVFPLRWPATVCVGEPPLMLAISVREAIRDAVAAFGDGSAAVTFPSPATPERVFFAVRHARAEHPAFR